MGKRVSVARPTELRAGAARGPVVTRAKPEIAIPAWLFWLICVALAGVTLSAYWQTTHFELTNVDDPDYIINNPHVRGGLTWQNFLWAFHVGNAANWHPLTWITHMLDC